MAQIDSSIYLKQEAPDILGGYERGLKMRDMAEQRNKQKITDKIYQSALVTNPDGTFSYDPKRGEAEAAKAGGTHLLEFKQKNAQMAAEEMKAKKEKMDFDNNLLAKEGMGLLSLPSIEERQKAYPMVLERMAKNGFDISMAPQQYDENFVKSALNRSLTYQEKIANDLKEKELVSKSLDRRDAREERRTLAGIKERSGENLPIDKKKFVESLSTKNANKLGIKNQIDSVMSNWEKLSESEQLDAGRQLLKTLNSPEGADAIGAEEAKRLGSRLEFAMGNFTNSNPTQFGRDLEGFKKQAMNTASSLGQAVQRNQKEIDTAMGRDGQTSQMVQVISPNGKTVSVPQNQVQAALKAGGKLVGGNMAGR